MGATQGNPEKKGRLTLSINQELLDRLEPYKRQVNVSAQAEKMLAEMLERLENLAWLEQNRDDLVKYGLDITRRGLAGKEFERI